ncbi:terminase small subunit [Staphylococcus pseudintermedius]|nr:terminase small subunit [Staphylococcus pseudintermedius]EGQ0378776.1 terminase small subunit [Staphylococcus pseudintermedius]EGQ0388644.1 terminase small subunit [Staphylococcus pseudintermedius]EGQ1302456.1 terminase small subunit [Staphylococcus pseudintermedius]EGQ1634332.1 terminase small subunit [Staphylococcus pseudintermedius]EGQ1639508.1 terminase small subunit [Staphylococcus pseudintermedius]
MSKITPKQQRFADEYLKTLNATQAAKNAGYSQKTAYSIGHRLLQNENVSAYITAQKDKIMDENILEAKELLYLLSRAATGEETESREMLVKKGNYEPNPDNERHSIIYNEHVEIVEVPIKISDRNKARELLGKYHKTWTENHNINVEGVSFIDDI